jgi:hypothetical protein
MRCDLPRRLVGFLGLRGWVLVGKIYTAHTITKRVTSGWDRHWCRYRETQLSTDHRGKQSRCVSVNLEIILIFPAVFKLYILHIVFYLTNTLHTQNPKFEYTHHLPKIATSSLHIPHFIIETPISQGSSVTGSYPPSRSPSPVPPSPNGSPMPGPSGGSEQSRCLPFPFSFVSQTHQTGGRGSRSWMSVCGHLLA